MTQSDQLIGRTVDVANEFQFLKDKIEYISFVKETDFPGQFRRFQEDILTGADTFRLNVEWMKDIDRNQKLNAEFTRSDDWRKFLAWLEKLEIILNDAEGDGIVLYVERWTKSVMSPRSILQSMEIGMPGCVNNSGHPSER